MKKVLLASTALVLSAGVAAADMTLSGSGRMGVLDSLGLRADAPDDIGFTSRIRAIFTGSGETDGGLSFGGSIRADNSVGGNAGTAGSVFISGDFGTLTMGDVSGAPEWAVGDVSGVGLTGLGDINEAIYLSNNQRPAARYEYNFGDFGVAISADNPDSDTEAYGLGAKYTFSGITAGIGFEDLSYREDSTIEIWGGDDDAGLALPIAAGTDAQHIIGGLSGTFAGFTGQAIYGQAEFEGGAAGDADVTQWQVSVDYTFDATTVTAYYAALEIEDFDGSAWGIGASYDLGGGASLRGGWVDAEFEDVEDDAFDFGISFTF